MHLDIVHAFSSIFATFAYVFFTFFISIPTLFSNHSIEERQTEEFFLLLILMQLIKRRKMNILLVLYHADDMASVADKNIYYPSKNDFSLVNKSNNPICITRNLKVTSFTIIGSIHFTNIHHHHHQQMYSNFFLLQVNSRSSLSTSIFENKKAASVSVQFQAFLV